MAIGLATDPGYLAYLRALGLDTAFDEDDTSYEIDGLRSALNRELPRIAEAGEEQRMGISSNYGGRGLFRSGGHEAVLAKQRAREMQQVGDVTRVTMDQMGDLERQLAKRRLRRQTGAAEQGLTVGTRIDSEVF